MFRHSIPLETADKIVDTAIAEGKTRGFQPMTAVVLDDGGRIKVLKRSDGSSLMREEIAIGKAFGALALGFGGRELQRRADEKQPAFIDSLSALCGGRCVPVPGGVLIRDADGVVVGAVGVTGDASPNDEICAVAGVEAVGLKADTGD